MSTKIQVHAPGSLCLTVKLFAQITTVAFSNEGVSK